MSLAWSGSVVSDSEAADDMFLSSLPEVTSN